MDELKKRHFYNEREYVLDIDNQVIKLSETFHKKLLQKKLWGRFGFKKIGGSSVGDVLETDQFKSPFKSFARISWIDMPILDKKYINAGIAIEPKVLALISSQKGITEVECFDPKKYNYDYFAGVDDIIGGLPDGLVKPHNIVLEIKTTNIKNLDNWTKLGVPAGYLKQAQLYTYLMNLDKYAIVTTFLKNKDYANPQMYPIEDRKTKTWFGQINKAEKAKVEDDINFVKTWYKKHTQSGKSPKYDERRDKDLIDFLLCKNESEWETLYKKWLQMGKIQL